MAIATAVGQLAPSGSVSGASRSQSDVNHNMTHSDERAKARHAARTMPARALHRVSTMPPARPPSMLGTIAASAPGPFLSRQMKTASAASVMAAEAMQAWRIAPGVIPGGAFQRTIQVHATGVRTSAAKTSATNRPKPSRMNQSPAWVTGTGACPSWPR